MPSKAGLLRVLSARLLSEDFCCLILSIFIVFHGDKLGRRRAVLLEILVMLIGTAIQASSFEQRQLLIGRIVTGVGNGWIHLLSLFSRVRWLLRSFGVSWYFLRVLWLLAEVYLSYPAIERLTDICSHDFVPAELRILLHHHGQIWIVPVEMSHRIPGSLWFHLHSWTFALLESPRWLL